MYIILNSHLQSLNGTYSIAVIIISDINNTYEYTTLFSEVKCTDSNMFDPLGGIWFSEVHTLQYQLVMIAYNERKPH